MTLSVKLDNFGIVYAVAINQSEDLGKPKPFQISRGTNHVNIKKKSSMIAINEKYAVFEFSVFDLDPNTAYNLYVTAGSAHPGYPDLLNDASTQILECKTLALPIGIIKSTTSGHR